MKTANRKPPPAKKSLKVITINGKKYKCPFRDVVPPLSPAEREALKKGILKNGVQIPIVVDENENVIDGAHRAEFAEELGLTEIPVSVRTGLSEEQKRLLAVDLNLHRRHLTTKQKRQIVASRLKADPTQGDRQIADDVGVHHQTVGAERERLELSGEILHSSVSHGRDGRDYKRERRQKNPPKNPFTTTAQPRNGAVDQRKDPTTPPSGNKVVFRNCRELRNRGKSLTDLGNRMIELAQRKLENIERLELLTIPSKLRELADSLDREILEKIAPSS